MESPSADTLPCPHCEQPVKASARICKHCKEEIPSRAMSLGSTPAIAAPRGATFASDPLPRTEPVTTLLLGIVTLGILPIVKFYQTARSYERLVGRPSQFGSYFWGYVAAGVVGLLLAPFGIGFLGWLASAALAILALREALRLRDELRTHFGIRVQLTEATTHLWLYGGSLLLSFVVIGLFGFIAQAALYFSDHEKIALELTKSDEKVVTPIVAAVPEAATAPPPRQAMPGRFCTHCGHGLDAASRFCPACGAAAAA